jgi:hypothetical protein
MNTGTLFYGLERLKMPERQNLRSEINQLKQSYGIWKCCESNMHVSYRHEIEREGLSGRLLMYLLVMFHENYLKCSHGFDITYHVGLEFQYLH